MNITQSTRLADADLPSAGMGCGLPNAGAWECPTPQNQLPNSEDCYTRSLHYHRTVEVLTEWTVSLASSALHLKGLSQQVTFLLDEKE